MAARGHGPYEGRAIQVPGMMRHGPYPGTGPHRALEPLPPPELLENKVASQAAEIERFLRENQMLAATHVTMRQEIGANQQEMQRIKSHIGSIRTESDIQIRGLLEKIRKMEDEIHAGEMVKKELQQAHKEAQSLIITRQELTGEIDLLTEEIQKASGNSKRLPELIAELDGFKQDHQKLRAAFEREKGSNMEQVEMMRTMEKNLISLAREIEKLRADVMNAEKGERVVNPYTGTYGSPVPLYSSASQGIGYGHGQGAGYPNAGFGHGSSSYATHVYAQPLPQMPSGAPKGNGTGFADGYARHHAQTSSGAAAVSPAGYSDGYGRPQAPVAGAGVSAGEGMAHYGGGRGV